MRGWTERYQNALTDDIPEMERVAAWLASHLPSESSVLKIQFYYVYALFKIAVIVQQIYSRWKKGLSKDARFANLIVAVHVLARTAARTIE